MSDDLILIVETPQAAGAVPAVTRVVHGPDVDEPLWLDRDGQLSVLHADGLGSIRLVTDAAQAVVERTDYTAFGVPTREGGVGQPFAYTGREWDGEIALYDYRARYYDPEVGRFLSRDPLELAAGPNPYTYVGNRPTMAIDPGGTSPSGNLDPWGNPPGHPCTSVRPWPWDCFWLHYVHGKGQAVDLADVGLLAAAQNAADVRRQTAYVKNVLQGFGAGAARAVCEGVNACDKSRRSFAFDDRGRFIRPLGGEALGIDLAGEPGLYVMGDGELFARATCVGIADCQSRTCTFDCHLWFHIRDKFARPLGIPLEVGTPYNLNADWVEYWSSGGGF